MSHRRRRGSGEGVVDGDPVAIIILLYMVMVQIFWFSSGTAINPLAGNSSITTAYSTGWTGIRWFGLLMAPFAIFLLVKGFAGGGSVEGDEEGE